MRPWNLEQRGRLDLFFAAGFCGIWGLTLCGGALLGSGRLIDFSLIPLTALLACLFSIRVRYDLLAHVRETEPEEGA